ncbi:hypothetical protein OHB26_38470 [Nocardia sp. NBC_01503]|uniref:hypothetical protein n=1 Tax=Nocardia sp. NBC_01503 TaxID=2975997 RepID=UPI002E7B4F74|nr:hypothetical protein [Nocardia sp. NBC_01503]WTL32664.1 hypothetical protein OHB26_38470 [Nocardia sp. NBC_01503]
MVAADDAEVVGTLTAGYDAVWCDGVAEEVATAAVVDLDATFAAAQAEVEAADSLFTEYQAAQSNKPIRPEWPEFVHPAQARQAPCVVDEIVYDVLVLARGIAGLADAWSDFESLRVARHFLTEQGGPAARPLPLVVR